MPCRFWQAWDVSDACQRASTPLVSLDACPESLHEVLCWLDLWDTQLDNFFMTLHLGLNQFHQRLLIRVPVLFEGKGLPHYLDQLTRELQLLLLHLRRLLQFRKIFRTADFICVMKSLHQNGSFIRPQRHQMLLLMHNHPADSDLPLLLQSLQHQEVRFLTIFIRDEIVARIKIDRIQFIRIYELENLHKSA